jgi:mono/diheme cytochrome c family protein
MKLFAATLVLLVILAAGGAWLFIQSGIYNVAATSQHTRPVYTVIEAVMKHSVRRRAGNIKAPPLNDPALLQQGFLLYREHCAKCHGAPGVPPDAFAEGMTPVPLNLTEVARLWEPEELYWATKYGLKMTGMPAWEFRFTDAQLWAVVGFTRQLAVISPEQYRIMDQGTPSTALAIRERPVPADRYVTSLGNQKRGVLALRQHACDSCHMIPGIVGADKVSGPPLAGFASRLYIAGILPNTPANLLRWIRDPKNIEPLTAMPNMRVNEKDARDMAAYLYTLE